VQHRQQPATTVAILGADTVVGSALRALLQDSGYRTSPLDSHPTGVADDLLDGADLLLLAPRLDAGAREAFLGAIGKSILRNEVMPVIALCTATEELPPDKEVVISLPWPSEPKVLVDHIEAALLDLPVTSTSPGPQAKTG
jgi:hypothetical protein